MKLKELLRVIKTVAKNNSVHPQKVTISMLTNHDATITEWELRKFGGLNNLKKNFPYTDKDLGAIKQQKTVDQYVRTLEEKLAQKDLLKRTLIETVSKSIKNLKVSKESVARPIFDKSRRNMTMELMLSDIHYGKKTPVFNSAVCRERMRHLCRVFLQEIRNESKSYNVHRVIVGIIGDIIESYEMHGLESAYGCEFGTSQQMSLAIESLFYDILLPIAKTGINIDVPCVTGNHDRTAKDRTMNDPGKNNVTWVIYHSLKMLADQSGLKNIRFYIPEGPCVVLPIYNNYCLFEHGDNTRGQGKKDFEALMEKRSRQFGKHIHFGRFGHYHEYACYDRGRVIVNESVCGNDSYAAVKGYTSSPGQTINYYIETKTRPTCFYKSFPVYLG